MRKLPLWAGHLLTTSGMALGLILTYYIRAFSPPINYYITMISFITLWFFPHCLAHYIVGRVFGIRFRYYFVGRSAIRKLNLPLVTGLAGRLPILGIRIEHRTLKKATPAGRFMMFSAGALASSLLPFLPVLFLFMKFPFHGSGFILLALINLGFTLYFSPKVGDIRRGLDLLRNH